jgi:internalin A
LLHPISIRKLNQQNEEDFCNYIGSNFTIADVICKYGFAQQPSIKTFAQWCQQRDSLHENTKHTIDVMIARAGTKDCQQAEHYFNKLNRHQSGTDEISDLRPIASLNNLTQLDLAVNPKIIDLKPLASLNNLTKLYLDEKFTKKDCPVKLEVCTWKIREQ